MKLKERMESPMSDNMFSDAVKKAIEIEVERLTKELVEKAKEELSRKIPQIVAGMSIKMMEHVSMRHMGTELVISVKMDNNL